MFQFQTNQTRVDWIEDQEKLKLDRISILDLTWSGLHSIHYKPHIQWMNYEATDCSGNTDR